MIVKCAHCGKDVEKEPRKIKEAEKKGAKLYCNLKCYGDSKRVAVKCNCAQCGKEIEKLPSEIKKSKTGNMFCDRSCACSFNNTLLRSGENHPNWIDGTSKSKEHSKKAFRTYKPQCAICKFNELAALQVHHIDEVNTNNSVENLIILCANHHSMVHYGTLIIGEDIMNSREYLE